MNSLLEVRKILKSKKPDFIRQQGNYVKGLEKKWRKPKGMHSKLRRKFRGKIKMPSIGYSSPSIVRFHHPSGLLPILINSIQDLSKVKKNSGLILGSTMGKRKKTEIIKKALELKLKILNLKDPEKFIEKVKEEIELKRRLAKEKQEKKKKVKEESTKKEEAKQELSQEEKEKQEKELKRKVLEGKK